MRRIPPLVYDHIIGTGGIGSGIFFSLKGNETLGREESRMAALLPYKDYCKQHIIMHYITVLLEAKPGGRFQSFPIGKVGNDQTGKILISQMSNAGMHTAHIKTSNEHATLFSVCYQYPDHAGGNITTAESASSNVLPGDIDDFFTENINPGSKGIILAAPEVPVETRIRLLEHGRQKGYLNVAAVQSAEIAEFNNLNGFTLADLLFINLDEARKIAAADETNTTENVALSVIRTLIDINPAITVFITCGAAGVYCYAKNHLEFFPSFNVEVISTAGAGDAFMAGTLTGMCCGLPLFKNSQDNASILNTATELGTLVAAISVTSQDSIHMGINRQFLKNFIKDQQLNCSDAFLNIFN
ncbi:MAG TPA: carbohydrate kinase family protein [Flavitalea sp.]|nr:carbohydrate kinase family protein [Flavitalea sp.]